MAGESAMVRESDLVCRLPAASASPQPVSIPQRRIRIRGRTGQKNLFFIGPPYSFKGGKIDFALLHMNFS
jgi:hypothetical protein